MTWLLASLVGVFLRSAFKEITPLGVAPGLHLPVHMGDAGGLSVTTWES